MIIIGTYPDAFELNNLSSLNQILNEILPQKLCLHIFPFYPNSGDFGYAPDDWFHIREDLGQWEDIYNLSSKWKIIVDGIYNHVGVNHVWSKNFKDDPEYYSKILHAYKNCSIDQGPFSPRGQPVLVKSHLNYYFWKTFSHAAIDIRLDSDIVQKKITEHLTLLASVGIWGVRLDAVAYYSKFLGAEIRHNHGVFKIANKMADKVRSQNLKVLAQLDCDEDGLKYFADETRKNIPINDFTYSTFLALSILEEDPEILMRHIEQTKYDGRIIVRVPRTHDGILLRSKLLREYDKEKILNFADSKKIKIRIANGTPYELNCSAPYLYSLINPGINVYDTILFSIAVTGMMPGWSYFYLPYIMGYIPEIQTYLEDFTDPRALNRIQITKKYLDKYLNLNHRYEVYSLLSTLNKIHSSQDFQFKTDYIINKQLLVITTIDGMYSLIANFDRSKKYQIPKKYSKGKILRQNKFIDSELDAFGFVIISLT